MPAVGGGQPPPTAAALREYIKGSLPEFMCPSAFVLLERMPLTPNDKIDRGALPAPDPTQGCTELLLPTNALEARVLAIYCQVSLLLPGKPVAAPVAAGMSV